MITGKLNLFSEADLDRLNAGVFRILALRHFRETWFPQYLARGMWQGDEIEFDREQEMFDAAYQHYKECIARYTPPPLDEVKRVEMRRIVERARRHLLT